MKEVEKYIKSYQKDAIKVISQYLSSISKKKCLVKLPTGTGKTGIMAIAANMIEENVLIIVPNATLPEQTSNEIEYKFWDNIGYKPSLKKTCIIEETKKDYINNECRYIYIITIQTLLNVYKDNIELFTKIKKCIGLVLYDEGHREPAKKWSQVSRELNKKMILFTATPYRNDNYIFDIDKNYTYKYTMKNAIENNEVKTPIFKIIPNDVLKSDDTVVKYISKIAEDDNTKILVRCQKSERIKKLVNVFSETYFSLGCHSDFENSQYLYSTGRKALLHTDDCKIIIHSDMLIEGVNIPELNVLVFIDCFNNSKSIIQQIGRVLRCYNDETAVIYVPEDEYDWICEQWETYIQAEQNEDEYAYVNGKFRKKYYIDSEKDFYKEINFRKQANVYIAKNSVLEELIAAIKDDIAHLENLENVNVSFYEEGKLWVLCYQRKEPSRFLKNKFWFDYSLEYISLVEVKSDGNYYYFYYNSRRYALPEILDEINQVNIEALYNLIPENTEVRTVRYSNTSQYKIGAQTKTINGFALNGIPANLSEKLSFCRNALGRIEGKDGNIDRYVSTITSRISEKDDGDYINYIIWCKNIINEINYNSENKYFNRFAKISKVPKTMPTSIMLCFDFELSDKTETYNLDSQLCNINNNEFEFMIGSDRIIGTIEKNMNNKLRIVTSGAEDYYIKEKEYYLDEYIERKNFMVYFADEQIMYCNNFYLKPNIRTTYNDINDFDLWDNIFPISELKDCTNEKLGDSPNQAFNHKVSWPEDSVFGVLIKEINRNHSYIDYLICDDLGNEIADFIALSTSEKKVIFIHCKAGSSNISASAFQDVCGQAIKNVEYILTSNPENQQFIKAHYQRWKGKWKLKRKNDSNSYQADRNIKGDVKTFISEYKKIMQNVNSTKEVWLVTNGMSKSELKTELLKKKPSEQIPQLLYILNLTQDNLSQVGARMKILCKE